MALLSMLSRAAFICNVCFLLAIGILWWKHPLDADPGMSSQIIVMGFFLAIILNVLVTVWLIILRLAKKSVSVIPRSLIFINGCFLAFQIVLLLK
jgi:hypothetical protein